MCLTGVVLLPLQPLGQLAHFLVACNNRLNWTLLRLGVFDRRWSRRLSIDWREWLRRGLPRSQQRSERGRRRELAWKFAPLEPATGLTAEEERLGTFAEVLKHIADAARRCI